MLLGPRFREIQRHVEDQSPGTYYRFKIYAFGKLLTKLQYKLIDLDHPIGWTAPPSPPPPKSDNYLFILSNLSEVRSSLLEKSPMNN